MAELKKMMNAITQIETKYKEDKNKRLLAYQFLNKCMQLKIDIGNDWYHNMVTFTEFLFFYHALSEEIRTDIPIHRIKDLMDRKLL